MRSIAERHRGSLTVGTGDDGRGLAFAMMGVLPARRAMLTTAYTALTLKNGVPTGYVLTSALYGSAEVAFNVFDTFRGFEAAATYARTIPASEHSSVIASAA